MLYRERVLYRKGLECPSLKIRAYRTNSTRLKQGIQIIRDSRDSCSSIGSWKELPFLVIFERGTASDIEKWNPASVGT